MAEARWKARPTIASAVGGMQDQIEDGVSGMLLANPRDRANLAQPSPGFCQIPRRPRGWAERTTA